MEVTCCDIRWGQTGGLDNADVVDSRRRVGATVIVVGPVEHHGVSARVGDVKGGGIGLP